MISARYAPFLKELEAECNKHASHTFRSWLKETYQECGIGVANLSEMLDISSGALRHFLGHYKIPVMPPGNPPYQKPPKERLSRDYCSKGMNMRELGEKYGVSRQTICNWLEQDRIEARPNHRRSGPLKKA